MTQFYHKTKCTTDSVWSLQVFWLRCSVIKPGEPVLYYLLDSLPCGSFHEELLLDGVLKR